MYSSRFSILLLLSTSLLLLSHSAFANPVKNGSNLKEDIVKESLEELNDLNEQSEDSSNNAALESEENSPEEPPFRHHDEDLPRNQVNTEMDQSLKYEVEILESPDIKKENNEIEEQYKGAGIQMNTDTFVSENIEVSGGDDNSEDDRLPQSHVALTVILVIVALVSIGLYAALVIWRAHLEQRYGMRELLVTNDNDEDFCPQRNGNRRASTTGSDSNNRHFVLGLS